VSAWPEPPYAIPAGQSAGVHFGTEAFAVVGIKLSKSAGNGGRAIQKSEFGIFTAKPLVEQTNGFTYPCTVPFSRTAIVGLSNGQWSMSRYHRRSVRPKKHMPLAVALKRSFEAMEPVVLACYRSNTFWHSATEGAPWCQVGAFRI
jgi:hypothetical protein